LKECKAFYNVFEKMRLNSLSYRLSLVRPTRGFEPALTPPRSDSPVHFQTPQLSPNPKKRLIILSTSGAEAANWEDMEAAKTLQELKSSVFVLGR